MEHISRPSQRSFSDVFKGVAAQRATMTAEDRVAEIQERYDRSIELSRDLARQSRERYFASLREHLGDRFASRRFSTWRRTPATDKAYEAALEVSRSPRKRGLWLVGPVELGKTHLCAAIGHEALDKQIPALFTNCIRLLERVKDSYDGNGVLIDGKSDIIGAYASVDVLVLDDLGKERFTAWAAERMYELINRRYEANRPLVVSSNLPPPKLASLWTAAGMDEHYGKSIVRRIIEMCSRKIVTVGA